MQFRFLSRQEAKAYLAQYEGPSAAAKTGDSVGDRIAALRRIDYVTTAEERAAARDYARRHPFTLKPWE
jgi:hypothetical protein